MKNKNNLSEALFELKIEELNNLPAENEIEYEFSSNFNKKAKRLTKTQKNKSSINTLRLTGEIAVVFIIALIVFVAASNTNASDNPKFDFLYKIFDNIVSINSEYNEPFETSKTTYYSLKYIPEGYVEIGFSTSPANIITIYENPTNGKRIRFTQTVGFTNLTNSNGNYVEEITIGDINILYINNGDFVTCYWSENNNYFLLSYPTTFGKDLILKNAGQLTERFQ